MRATIAAIYRTKDLRYIAVIALAILVAFPAYQRLWVYPQFSQVLIDYGEAKAKNIGSHLATMSLGEIDRVSPEILTTEFHHHVTLLRQDLYVTKIKLFSPDGTIIYSTDEAEVGTRNTKKYFQDIVAAGNHYSQFVSEDSVSAEGELFRLNVVETYVPIMHENAFAGAFEIYYNISDVKSQLDSQLTQSMVVSLTISTLLTLTLIYLLIRRAKGLITAHMAFKRLLDSEAKFRGLTSAAQDGIIMVDNNRLIKYLNSAAARLLGYVKEELMDKDLYAQLLPERYRKVADDGFRKFKHSGKGEILDKVTEIEVVCKNGREIPVELSTSAMLINNRWHAVGIFRDISERKKNEQRLKLAASVMRNAWEGIMITDAKWRITNVNKAFTDITEYEEAEVIGKTPTMLSSGRQGRAFYRAMLGAIKATGGWQGEVWNRRKSGELYPELLNISAIRDERGHISHYVGIFSDISQRKQEERILRKLAFQDPLTGLPNRHLFRDRLDQVLTHARRTHEKIAVMFGDLDRFKAVNDSMGHDVGDLLLQEVAQRIKDCLRESDTVARLGGDEFTIIIQELGEIYDAKKLADEIIAEIGRPYLLRGRICQVGASIGIALFPDHGETAEQLIKLADAAMYTAKDLGKNRSHVYHDNPPERVTKQGTD